MVNFITKQNSCIVTGFLEIKVWTQNDTEVAFHSSPTVMGETTKITGEYIFCNSVIDCNPAMSNDIELHHDVYVNSELNDVDNASIICEDS